MRSIAALVRASFLSATSYRLGMLLSIAGLLATFIPLYFVSGALQPLVQDSIRQEGGQYFGFAVIGMGAMFLVSTAVGAIPSALSGSIASGTLEALLVTRTPLYQILIGMVGYGVVWTGFRAALLLIGAAAVGVHVAWTAMPYALMIALLLMIAYSAIGLVAGALVMVFRTAGPLNTGVIALSGMLGGAYWSTSVIPSWLQHLSAVIPLTYALRPMRKLLLGGESLSAVSGDVFALAGIAVAILSVSMVVFVAALRHARRAGTLSQY